MGLLIPFLYGKTQIYPREPHPLGFHWYLLPPSFKQLDQAQFLSEILFFKCCQVFDVYKSQSQRTVIPNERLMNNHLPPPPPHLRLRQPLGRCHSVLSVHHVDPLQCCNLIFQPQFLTVLGRCHPPLFWSIFHHPQMSLYSVIVCQLIMQQRPIRDGGRTSAVNLESEIIYFFVFGPGMFSQSLP